MSHGTRIAQIHEQIFRFYRLTGGVYAEFVLEEDRLDRPVSLLPVVQLFLDAVSLRGISGNRSDDQGIRIPARHDDPSGKFLDRTRRVGTEEI